MKIEVICNPFAVAHQLGNDSFYFSIDSLIFVRKVRPWGEENNQNRSEDG